MAAVGLGAARSLGLGAPRARLSSRSTRVTASAVSSRRGAATATGVVFAWLLAVALVVGLAWAINRYVEAPAARAFEWLLLPRRG